MPITYGTRGAIDPRNVDDTRLQVLGGADVQVEQPAQRQVDGDDLVEVDPLVDALQRVEVLLPERERCRRPQVGPLVAVEREVPIGHVENLRSSVWHRRKQLASCSAPGTRRRRSSTSSSTTCCAASDPAPRPRLCACSIPRAVTGASCSLSPSGSPTGHRHRAHRMRRRRRCAARDRRAGAGDRGRRARATTGATPRSTSWSATHPSSRRWRPPRPAAVPAATAVGRTPTQRSSSWRWPSGWRAPTADGSGSCCRSRSSAHATPAPVRAEVARMHELTWSWWAPRQRHFDAAVERLRARLRADGTPRSRPRRRRWTGVVTDRLGIPALDRRPAGARRHARRTSRDQRQLPRRVLRARARRARGRRRPAAGHERPDRSRCLPRGASDR